MEIQFVHKLKTGEIIEVTASDTTLETLEWGITTAQCEGQSMLLSRVLTEESLIVDRAWELINERRAEALEVAGMVPKLLLEGA